jgi:voltage-gated potassium channel
MSPPDPGTPPPGRRRRAFTLFNPPATAASPEMARWRVRLNEIIFQADTPGGRAFDIALLWVILASVAAVLLESVDPIAAEWGAELRAFEWAVTGLFTVEYLLRLISVRRPAGYATSFFGIIDLLSVFPTYLGLFVAGAQTLIVLRVLRILRIFRLLQLSQFIGQAEVLTAALLASRAKIIVFIVAVLDLIVIIGAAMYLIEGPASGFTSIPRSIYWAVVTLTTVGYGDIAPETWFGQLLAGAVMILGYAIIAVPTGIVSVELAQATRSSQAVRSERCPGCGTAGHDADAGYCKRCGRALPPSRGGGQAAER